MQTYIVIGAGILGATTAYHLAKAGATVTLVDRDEPGKATDAATGIICPWLSQRRNQAWYKLAKSGAKYYPTLIKQLEDDGETDTGYKKVGAISIHTEDEKLDKIEGIARKRRLDAPGIGDITRLSKAETHKLFPPLKEEYGSVYISGAARVHGKALRQSLINAAKKHGATILKGSASLIYHDHKVTGVSVADKMLLSDQVIATSGAWANELLEPLGVHFLGTFQKGQVVHIRMENTDTSKWPVVMPPNDQAILAFDEGHVVIGATHENETGFDNRATVGGLHEIFEKALSVAPGLANSTILETRVGFRPFTPGFLPVIGTLPNYEGLLIANGLGASGLTVGPYLGFELANLALGKPAGIDLSPYDVALALESIK